MPNVIYFLIYKGTEEYQETLVLANNMTKGKMKKILMKWGGGKVKTFVAYYDNDIRLVPSFRDGFPLLASKFYVVYDITMSEDSHLFAT